MLSMTFLTDDERAYLKAQHKRERDRRICDRIKAVLLFDRGWSAASIAEALLLSEDAIRDHISEYKGSKKLKPESGGSIEKLSAEQSRQLEEYLQYHTYFYVKDISHHVIIQEDEMLNAEATIKFFQKIEEAYPKKSKIHLFCDNARYYRNQMVTKYLENSKIALHFLPPYSPNLNPIERLWKWMKERVIYNTYYEEFEEFKSAVLGFFGTLSKLDPNSELGQIFRGRIRDKFSPIKSPLRMPI